MSARRSGSTSSCSRTFVALLAVVGLVAGCATTKLAPPYLLSPDGIGVAVMSPPPSKNAIVATNWNRTGPMLEGVGKAVGVTGGAYSLLAPLALILEPFALAVDASVCNQKLDAAYPGLSEKVSEIVQREFSQADVQDQFVAVLQTGTSVPVAHEEILSGNDTAAGERQLLAAAAQHARAHLFLVEISSVSVRPSGKECDSWQVRADMQVQLWSVADRKLVLSYSPGYQSPFAAGPLSEIKSVFDEPGALRSRLMPTYDTAARMFFYRAMFRLPP